MGPGTPREAQRGRHTTGPFGPSVVLLAVLMAIALGTRSLDRGAERDRATAPRGAAPEAAVGVWLGHSAEGLAVRLSPLSREADRQAFDATALAARLGLPPGQPFRLECCAHVPDGEEAQLDFRVADDGGVALVPVASLLAFPTDPVGVVDPVLGLLAGPGSGAGGTVTVLWGRAPGAGARLLGAGGATGLAHSFVVPLAPSTVASGQLPGSTLRLANERLAGAEPAESPR